MDVSDSKTHTSVSREAQPVIAAFVSVSVALIVLVMRVITRALHVKVVGPEDYIMIVSLMFSIALSALIAVESKHGQGRHIDTISEDDLMKMTRAFWASVPVYQMALTLTKLSILLQYWRVFVSENFRKVVIVLFAFTSLYGIWSVCSTIFMCTPVSFFWNMKVAHGHCLNRYPVWFTNSALNIVSDVAIFLAPMPVLSQLRLPRRQRMALIVVFGLGAFVCLISMLRLRALYNISVSKDVTWDNGAAAAWSSLEVNVGIICASLPPLRKPISRVFPKIFHSTSGGNTSREATIRRPSRASALKRFPIAQEAANWARASHTPADYGRNDAMCGLDSKIECVSYESDGETVTEIAHSGIKVLTTTTQEVQVTEITELKAVVYPREKWHKGPIADFDIERMGSESRSEYRA